MVVIRRGQLPHVQVLGVEHDHAPLRLVDAAELLVSDGFARSVVSVDRQRDGNLGGFKFRRLIQQSGDPQSGNGFVAELFDLVARAAVDCLQPFDARGQIPPAGRLAAKDDAVESLLPGALGVDLPLRCRADRGHARNAHIDIVLDFVQRDRRIKQGASEALPSVSTPPLSPRLVATGRPKGITVANGRLQISANAQATDAATAPKRSIIVVLASVHGHEASAI